MKLCQMHGPYIEHRCSFCYREGYNTNFVPQTPPPNSIASLQVITTEDGASLHKRIETIENKVTEILRVLHLVEGQTTWVVRRLMGQI